MGLWGIDMTRKKQSYNDIVRANAKLTKAINDLQTASLTALHDVTAMMAKKELAVEILESVNKQSAEGLITKFELQQWRLKWNAYKGDIETPTEVMFDDLGIPNINEVYQDVYTVQEKLVSDVLLGYFLALEDMDNGT
jgi:hypothetical protein